MANIILANKLFVSAEDVDDDFLEGFQYQWVEEGYETVLDEYGDPVLNGKDEPLYKPVEEHKTLATYDTLFTGAGEFYAIPRGDVGKIKPFLRENWDRVCDQRSLALLGFKLKLKKKVKKDPRWKLGQKRCVREWMEHGYGIVKGDTGTGKTVIGTGIICASGLRTLILTKRKDGNTHWVEQIRKLTNIDKLERKYGKQIIGVYKSKKRKVYPITIATVQSFATKNGFKDLIKNRDYWGLMIPDECHELVTPKYKRIPETLTAVGIAALTATDEREDNLQLLEYDLFGPVVTQNKGQPKKRSVTVIHTGIKAPGWIYKRDMHPGYRWHKCMETLEKSGPRYDLMMEWLYDDIEKGYRIIVISPQRTKVIMELAKRLRQDGYKVAYVDGKVKNRQPIYNAFDEGKYDVLLAGKVLNALVDIQTGNCVHLVTPLKSHTAIRQVTGRARELDAVIRDFADEGGQFSGCFRSRLKFYELNGWDVKQVDMRGHTKANQPTGMADWKMPD